MRWKKIAAALLAATALAAAGCGPNNADPCKKYVEHLNSLPCRSGDKLNEKTQCPDTLNAGDDCGAFYGCLTDKATCDGDTFKNDAEQCLACGDTTSGGG